jgi:ATP-dependent protease Clp ATPase subunit
VLVLRQSQTTCANSSPPKSTSATSAAALQRHHRGGWEEEKSKELRGSKPAEIKNVLDEYVVGQEPRQEILAVPSTTTGRSGPSEAGESSSEGQHPVDQPHRLHKTLLAQTLAEIAHVPFTIADAPRPRGRAMSARTWNIILRLLQAADYDVEQAQRGIVYIDEIDKIARKGKKPLITDIYVSGGRQQAAPQSSRARWPTMPPQGEQHRAGGSSGRHVQRAHLQGRSSGSTRWSRTA